jgi:hypothetical protein
VGHETVICIFIYEVNKFEGHSVVLQTDGTLQYSIGKNAM